MSSAFLQVQRAIAQRLQAIPPLADGRIYLDRQRPIAQEEPSAINLRLLEARSEIAVIGAIDWRTTLSIECAARSDPGGRSAAEVADELLGAVFVRLRSQPLDAQTVIDEAEDAGIEWDTEAEDTPYICVTLRLTIVHRTPGHNLEPWT